MDSRIVGKGLVMGMDQGVVIPGRVETLYGKDRTYILNVVVTIY